MDEEILGTGQGEETAVEGLAGGASGGDFDGGSGFEDDSVDDSVDDVDLEDLPLFGEDDGEMEEGQEDEGRDGQEDEGRDGQEGQEGREGREGQEGDGQNGQEDGQEAREDPLLVEIDGEAVPLDDVVQAAQIGRQAIQEALQLREQVGVLDEFAKIAGMNRTEYIQALRGQLEQARVQQQAEQLGVAPEAAAQILQARQQQQEAQAALQRQQAALQAEQQRKARIAPYMELIQRYPDLQDPAKMPPEVMRQIQQGAHPVIAYQDYMLRQQTAAGQVAQKRKAVQEKSPGSAAGVGNGQVDDALAAFMAEFD